MSDIASLHPVVVHFSVALLFVGVLLRWIAFADHVFPFAGHAALLLLMIGGLSTLVAVQSGRDAHGPAERLPGVRAVVHEHEQAGEQTRNAFVLVMLCEMAAWFLRRRRGHKALLLASAIVGSLGLVSLYQTAELGGTLVYEWAGGVGTRSGERDDVGHLLMAGLYHQGQLDRQDGRHAEAAELFALAARRFPDDFEVQLLLAQSMIRDLDRPEDALTHLRSLVPPEQGRTAIRHGLLLAEAHKAKGDVDSGRRELERLAVAFPGSRTVERAIEQY